MARIKGDRKVLDHRDNAGAAQPGNPEIEVIMKQSSVIGHQLSVKAVTAVVVLVLVTLHCSLITAFGEEIQARAAVVMDASTGRVLYAKNPELRLMPASTTKLMTALITVERANLQDVVTVSRAAANVAPTRSGFREGDKVTIETLLYAALMKSANDAAVALAEAVGGSQEEFVQLMNRKAIAIGATDTRFINPNGLPGKGQHTTAFDLAKIMRQAIKHPVLKAVLGTRVTELSTEAGKTVTVKNTNKLLWTDEDLLGGKTGFTYAARHCFVCAGERADNTLIVALLGAPSRSELWKETEGLMEFGFRVMQNQEEPVVYLTRADYDTEGLTQASYTKKAKGKTKVKGKAKAKGKAKVKAKPKVKKKTKMMVKTKKAKRTNVAAKAKNGANG
ncbi:MAG: D-alanyl-D-alanine carboxypeptidase [Nitrospirae bacterium]|nr:D-alanyl-D-alanine carboxypeptidase [Nitrospirota bacterium]